MTRPSPERVRRFDEIHAACSEAVDRQIAAFTSLAAEKGESVAVAMLADALEKQARSRGDGFVGLCDMLATAVARLAGSQEGPEQ